MKVQRVCIPETDTVSWFVLGDDFLPIQPIHSFLRYLENLERSPNTIRAYAGHLKLYWEYLTSIQLDWTKVRLSELAEWLMSSLRASRYVQGFVTRHVGKRARRLDMSRNPPAVLAVGLGGRAQRSGAGALVELAALASGVGALLSLSQASGWASRQTGSGGGVRGASAAGARHAGGVEAPGAVAVHRQAARATLQPGAEAGAGSDCARDANGLWVASATIAISSLENRVCAIPAVAQGWHLGQDLGQTHSALLT